MVARAAPRRQPPPDNQLWTKPDVADYCQISIGQLDRLVKCGRGPPVTYLGGAPRWRPEGVKDWLAKLEGGERFSALDAVTKAAP